jgi:serine/threonine protein kinase
MSQTPDPSAPDADDIAPLLRMGLKEDTDATILVSAPTPRSGGLSGDGARSWEPPTVETLQKALPQYEVSAFIARGGMGAVYKGTQKTLKRAVAIKVLPPDIDDVDMQFAARFKHEAQAMARLTHPNIVAVHDAGETADGLLYFVMEFIEGTDVQQLIASERQIDPKRTAQITCAVCEALAFAHEEGIVHRDIKPSNIMIDKRGRVKVADFGLAKTVNIETTLITRSDMAMGTPDFVAPEALIFGTKVDGRADIYAVGVMLYQMLTGKIPRGRFELPSGVIPQMDKGFDAIVDKAMQTDREKRYSTALEMKTDVERVRNSGFSPSGSVPPDGLKPELRAKSRKPLIFGAAATLIITASGWLLMDESTEAERISSPSSQASQSLPLSDRDAALRVLAKGAGVTIRTAAGATQKVTTVAALPAETFDLEGVETAQLSKTFDDETLVALAGLPKLTKVKLLETSITGKGLQVVTTLPALRTLSLDWNMGLKDADLALLSQCPLLEEFALWHPEMFTPAALEHVSHLTELTKLDLQDFPLRPEDVRPLLQLKKLEFLAMGGTPMDAAMLEQLRQLPELLDLRFTMPQGGGRVDFSSFPKLKRVGLFEGITVGMVESLAAVRGIEQLTISIPGKLDPAVISQIALSLKGLTSLSLTLDQPLTGDAPFSELASLPKLAVVTMGNHTGINQFDDAALLSLAGVATLKTLKIETLKHRVTKQGLADFQKRRPDVKLVGVEIGKAAQAVAEIPYATLGSDGQVHFPEGKWAWMRTREEEARDRAENIIEQEGGWILWRSKTYAPKAKPETAPVRNLGVRVWFRGRRLNDHDYPQINLRAVAGQSPSLNLHIRSGKLQIRHSRDGFPVLAEEPLREPLVAGKEYQAEFYAIGTRVIARVNGQTLSFETDVPPVAGQLSLYGANMDWFKDAHVLNLDGLSEADALKLVGVSMSP